MPIDLLLMFSFKPIRQIVAIVLILLLVGCSSLTPPRELAPGGEVIKKAIALSLVKTQSTLAEQLRTAAPEVKISSIKIEQLEPRYIAHLAAYHLQGTYNLKLQFGERTVNQKANPFDLYLQRQAEGKTWRLLQKDRDNEDEEHPRWFSYSLR
jgi:hypothetical protein